MERKRELPIAAAMECDEMRNSLISKGTIVPAKPGMAAAQIRKFRRQERERLIELGIIDPELCRLPSPILPRVRAGEEGEYKPTPISSDGEYYRRRQTYFRMVQEILQSRRELRLVLGPKGNNDPEWVF